MPVQFSAMAMIEHWIRTLNELGMRSKQGRTLLAINIWEPNLTKCFVSTLDRHFWCVFFLSFDQGCLGLEPKACLYMELS